MENSIRLIWDFYGEDAAATAKHHAIHLQEYIQRNQDQKSKSGEEELSDEHSIAYLEVSLESMPTYRDALKPHRGQKIVPEA